ncbi:MAG: single-stranded DNA-binding protein [Mesorhizobium sp.]|uniref:single-stranded DNA-binding protein n=1 Tax=Mesorhizobium sp. TaxID=1871066 RepID=UPI000FE73C00|nr:single-stranded DNA-binding protein [Mesorhizobium sp.]RWF74509.1 MAG: single-stranded DNA-binding protein [Mesorhizobium sp.]TIN82109.1 MAG: single-stranded DNA-binding protein [Mesorhizobium sp.]
MAGYLNKVQLIGNVGDDPDINKLNNGGVVANFSIATTESWKDKNTGEKKERTEWHRIVVFSEGLCNVIEQYVRKGSKLYVEGELQTRKWQDQQGNDRWSTEVVLSGFDAKLILLGSKGGGGDRDPNGNADRPGNKAGGGSYAEKSGGTARQSQGQGDNREGFSRQRGEQRQQSRELDDEIPF